MTAPQPAASRRGPLLAIAAIVILALAGIGLWYLFFRPAGPAPVSLGSTTPTEVASATAVAEASTDPSGDREDHDRGDREQRSSSAGGGPGCSHRGLLWAPQGTGAVLAAGS